MAKVIAYEVVVHEVEVTDKELAILQRVGYCDTEEEYLEWMAVGDRVAERTGSHFASGLTKFRKVYPNGEEGEAYHVGEGVAMLATTDGVILAGV